MIGDQYVIRRLRQLLRRFLSTTHVIDLKTINWVSVAPNLRQTTLFQGQADAAVGHLNTVVTGMHKLGAKDDEMTIMPYADFGVRLYGNAVIVKPDWARSAMTLRTSAAMRGSPTSWAPSRPCSRGSSMGQPTR